MCNVVLVKSCSVSPTIEVQQGEITQILVPYWASLLRNVLTMRLINQLFHGVIIVFLLKTIKGSKLKDSAMANTDPAAQCFIPKLLYFPWWKINDSWDAGQHASVRCRTLGLRKRTSDSRGLHPSASPHHPPIRPPPPPPPRWHFVQRRSKGKRDCWGGDRLPWDNTSHARTRQAGNFDLTPSQRLWRKWRWWRERATFLLPGRLRCVGRVQYMMPLDSYAQWRFIYLWFAPRFADGAVSLCLHLGQPNESEGSLSALFPAPLHMEFPAAMSAIFRSLFLGKSLPIPSEENQLIRKRRSACVRLTMSPSMWPLVFLIVTFTVADYLFV